MGVPLESHLCVYVCCRGKIDDQDQTTTTTCGNMKTVGGIGSNFFYKVISTSTCGLSKCCVGKMESKYLMPEFGKKVTNVPTRMLYYHRER